MYFNINPILFVSKNHSVSPSIFYIPYLINHAVEKVKYRIIF